MYAFALELVYTAQLICVYMQNLTSNITCKV